MSKTDFMGNEYGEGDYVVYSVRSGSSQSVTVAEVLEENEKSLKVRPVGSSNSWRMEYYKWVDKRTGEDIHPYEHTETPSGYYHPDGRYEEYVFYGVDLGEWEWRPPVYKDYVAKLYYPAPTTTLTSLSRVVKYTGAVPEPKLGIVDGTQEGV